jgi:hypothetical protein
VAPSPSVLIAVTLPTTRPAHLDVGLRVELGADPVDLERDGDARAERPRVLRHGEPGQQHEHAEEGETTDGFHPATRTDVSVP